MTGTPRKKSVYTAAKMRSGNSTGLRVLRHRAMTMPQMRMSGAHCRNSFTSTHR